MSYSTAARRSFAPPLPSSTTGTASMPFGWAPRLQPEMREPWEVAWESTGPEHAPALFVLGGISADRHVTATEFDPRPGWWSRQVGAGLTVDPERWRIVSMDFLGTEGPAGDSPHRLHLLPQDQADAVFAVLDHLGVERVHAAVGSSYGGSVALAAAIARPERFERLIMLAAAHRPHPHATALRLIQRRIVETAVANGSPAEGLALSRALAFTTYRTAVEFDDRFDHRAAWADTASVSGTPESPAFEVSGYLDNRGAVFARSVDPNSFLSLSESIDLCDLDPSELHVPAYLISFNKDTLVPPWLVNELEARVPGPCCHFRLNAKCGHDGFLMGASDLSAALAVSLTTWPEKKRAPRISGRRRQC